MDYSEIFAKHGLVLVQAKDVRKMMDYYQLEAASHYQNDDSHESYDRLWKALHAVGLDNG